jgi:hypothetical protein
MTLGVAAMVIVQTKCPVRSLDTVAWPRATATQG